MAAIPKYEIIKQDLQKKIEENILPIGTKLDSESELAEQYQVSTITIKRALNELSSEGFIDRIKGTGSFIKQQNIKNPSRIIHFIYEGHDLLNDKLGNTIIFNMLKGIQHILTEKNFLTVVKDAKSNIQIEMDFIKQSIEAGAAGMLIYSVNPCKIEDAYLNLCNSGIPFVMLDRYLPYVDTNIVTTNNIIGAYKAIDYLIGLHHEKIGFASYLPLEITSITERLNGYEKALEKNGLQRNDDLIWIRTDIDELIKNVLNAVKSGRITGLFCINDSLAFFLIRELMRYNISIPDNLSIIGFDDVYDTNLHPIPLTTVHQPAFNIGVEAAKLLLESIDGNQQKKTIKLSPTLVIRKSCIENQK